METHFKVHYELGYTLTAPESRTTLIEAVHPEGEVCKVRGTLKQ